MDFLSTLDLVLIKVGLAGFLFAFAQSFIKRLRKPKARHTEFPLLTVRKANTEKTLPPTRQIQQRLQQTGKTCVIFYGTQTGTAEKFALRLAKDASTRYNLQCLVADLDDFDYEDLSHFSPDQIAIFLLATYGEGEPTDNAIAFNEFLRAREPQQRAPTIEKSAIQLQYAAFGLGNSSYQFYNSMIRRVDTVLQSCGATRIGDLGLGDDGKKTLEEDFAEWGAKTLAAIADHFHLRELEYDFMPDFQVTESKLPPTADVFLGEPNKKHLRNKIQGPFTQTNPLPARIVEARELFNSSDRNCLHFEFDLAGTTLTYETGDHLAVWPVNSDDEVDRFLKVFGLAGRKNAVIDIKSRDLSVKLPIPAPTTYEAAARYYLDIGAPVPRPLLGVLAKIATREPVRSELLRLSSDGAVFQHEVAGKRLTLAQTLSQIAPNDSFYCVPFSFILENVGKLQPRFYSISSSALSARKRISITAVVNSASSPDPGFGFKGVNTHYLLALKSAFSEAPLQRSENAVPKTHQINGPRGLFAQPTALVHVRPSKFRLPRLPSTPIIMIGPGTGVAPFRAFVEERALMSSSGRQVGQTILFYGCRRSDEDFLYKEEWQEYQKAFHQNTFSFHVAFSREKEQRKFYVQDLLHQHAAELKDLVLRDNAQVYVCGDASWMAKDVFRAFSDIIGPDCEKDFDEAGDSYLRKMKSTGRWSEDVW